MHCFGILWKCYESCCPIWVKLYESCFARWASGVGQAYSGLLTCSLLIHVSVRLWYQKMLLCVWGLWLQTLTHRGFHEVVLQVLVQTEGAAELGFSCLPASLHHLLSSSWIRECLFSVILAVRHLLPFQYHQCAGSDFPAHQHGSCPEPSSTRWHDSEHKKYAFLHIYIIFAYISIYFAYTYIYIITRNSMTFCAWWKIGLRGWRGAGWVPGSVNVQTCSSAEHPLRDKTQQFCDRPRFLRVRKEELGWGLLGDDISFYCWKQIHGLFGILALKWG